MTPADLQVARQFHDARARLARLSPAEAAPALREMAQRVRHDDLHMIYRAGLGHLGGDFSVTDILVTLYAGVLNVDPLHPLSAQRDRLVLSKGHTAGALYATLARCGFFAHCELETFAAPESAFNGHPNRTKVPGVETSTGPLGHGFPVAVGIALSARLQALAVAPSGTTDDTVIESGAKQPPGTPSMPSERQHLRRLACRSGPARVAAYRPVASTPTVR